MVRHPFLVILCSFLGLGVPAPAVQAGAKKAKVEFSYRMPPGDPIRLQDSPLYLRPNTVHGIELSVKNLETDKDEDALRDVVVRLMRVDGPKPVALTTAAKLDKLRSGEAARLVLMLDKTAEVGKGEVGKGEVGKGPPPQIQLGSPKLQLWLDAKGKETVMQDVKIQLDHPDGYVELEKAHYDRERQRFTVIVVAKKTFVGPVCPVQLVIDPDYIPGFKGIKLKTLERELTQIGQRVELYADLEFEGVPGDGRIFLTVDGFERAFEFLPNFGGQTGDVSSANYRKETAVRFRTRRYVAPEEANVPPDKKKPVIVTLEIDALPIDQRALVEFAINKSEDNKDDNKFETLPPGGFRGLRDVRLTVEAGKGGELELKMMVSDWKVRLDTSGLLGRRWLRLRVLEEPGAARKAVSRLALLPLTGERRVLAPLTLETNEVFAAITLDDSAVDGVKFVGLPVESKPNAKLEVQVTTAPRPESRFAPIEKALFYIGKKSEGKIEAEEVVEVKTPRPDGTWTANLLTPDKEGKYEVAVQFLTRADKRSAASTFVMIKAVKPGDVLTTLKGNVVDSAARGLPNVIVKLKDAKDVKGGVKAQQKAGEKGAFAFEKVAPGDYVLEVDNAIPSVRGIVQVTVPAGKEVLVQDIGVKMK